MKRSAPAPWSYRFQNLLLIRGPVIRRWTLLGITLGVPVFFLRTGSDPFNVPKLALLTVGLALVVSLWVAEIVAGAKRWGARRLALPAAGFVIPIALAWIASPYRGFTLMGDFPRFQGLVPYVLIVMFGLMLASAFDDRTAFLAWGLLIAGAIVGAYAIVQQIGADPFAWGLGRQRASQALSTLGNPNFTGGFLGIVLPMGVGLYALDTKRRSTIVKLLVPIVAGWLVARSEGGWAAGIAGLSIIGGFILVPRWRLAPLFGMVGALAVAVALLGAVTVTIGRTNTPLPYTVEERGQWWLAAARMGAASPALGRGPNAFAIEGVQYRTVDDALQQGFDYTDDPHSVPLSLFASAGVVGLLGYLVLVGWVAWTAIRLPARDVLGATFLAATAAYIVQSLVSIDELSLRLALWVGLAGLAVRRESAVDLDLSALQELGASPPSAHRKRPRAAQANRSRRVPSVVVAIASGSVFIAAVLWSSGLVLADHRFHTGLQLIREGRLATGRVEAERALSFRDDIHYRHLFAFELGRSALDHEDGDLLVAEMSNQFAFVEQTPDVPSLRDFGRLLYEWFLDSNEVAALKRAVEVYGRAVALDPLNPRLRVERAQALLESEAYGELVAELTAYLRDVEQDLARYPNARYPELWGYLALARHEAGGEGNVLEGVPPDLLDEVAILDPRLALLVSERLLAEGRIQEIEEVLAPIVAAEGERDPALHASIWAMLAIARAQSGDDVGARLALDRALELDAHQPRVLRAARIVKDEQQE